MPLGMIASGVMASHQAPRVDADLSMRTEVPAWCAERSGVRDIKAPTALAPFLGVLGRHLVVREVRLQSNCGRATPGPKLKRQEGPTHSNALGQWATNE
jgi:hypothetical protein